MGRGTNTITTGGGTNTITTSGGTNANTTGAIASDAHADDCANTCANACADSDAFSNADAIVFSNASSSNANPTDTIASADTMRQRY